MPQHVQIEAATVLVITARVALRNLDQLLRDLVPPPVQCDTTRDNTSLVLVSGGAQPPPTRH